ncbi:MAG TPA: hypothetical protein VGC32_15070 [Solirubrobacterales bacterium]
MFAIRIEGSEVSREALLPEFGPLDRLGVVVGQPFGAVGATHLIQLAIVAYYDARPARREGYPKAGDSRAVYPEIYLFHVGGRFGDHSHFDVWPGRKEVFVDADPRAVLDAINDRGITRLAVPESPPVAIEHEWKEPATAKDRIVDTFVYSPWGRVEGGTIEIEGLSAVTEINTNRILDPGSVRSIAKKDPHFDSEDPDLRARSWKGRIMGRVEEGFDGLDDAQASRSRIVADGKATETYERISIETGLEMLVPVPAAVRSS